MVKVSEIKDRESLEEWLLDRPEDETKKFAISIAHRAAMRVLPVYWEWVERSELAKKHELTALPVLLCNFTSGIACKMPTPEIRDAADLAFSFATTDTSVVSADIASAADESDTGVGSSAKAAIAAAETVYETGIHVATIASAADIASDSVAEVVSCDSTSAFWQQIRTDCAALETEDMVLAAPLWNGDENPFQTEWEAVRNSLPVATSARTEETARGALPVDWSFWINWYQDALEGREPDWDMLYEIALIPDEDWQKGPEHINNEVIAGIVEKYRLRRDVQALRKELAAVHQTATAAPMGHNNPPEGIEAEAEVVTQTEIIWAALEEAEEELSKPEPSPSVLKRVGTVILRAIAEVGKYGAKLGDVGLKATAATVGGGLGAYLISKGPEIQSIAERISEFVWP
ncbi:MAG TPA: hypothetical protein ENK34_10170 [Rhodobacteraceae bacterium]|nr:hypothetical protein [Paracoccaceae bacterium]